MKRTIAFLMLVILFLYSFTAFAFAFGLPWAEDQEAYNHEYKNWKAGLTQQQLMAMRGRNLQERIRIHGYYLKYDVPPVIKEGRTLIPVRAITNGMGAEVDWNPTDSAITITRDDIRIEFTLGTTTLEVYEYDGDDWNWDRDIEMDYPAKLISNRTFVPLRFIAEALGDKVHYDNDTGDIDVLERLETPERPTLEDFIAEWEEVEEAEIYKIRLFHNDEQIETVTTSALSYDFEEDMDEDGCYVVRVTALETEFYSTSRESKPSYPQIVGECDDLDVIEGVIAHLDSESDFLVRISYIDSEEAIQVMNVNVTEDTEIVIDGEPGEFEDLEIDDEVTATLYEEDLLKLEVDND